MFFGVVVFLNGCFSNRVGEKSHPYVHCLCNNSSDFANTFENKPRLWSYQSLIMCYKSFCLCLVYYTRKNVLALTHILWKFYSHILFFVTFFFLWKCKFKPSICVRSGSKRFKNLQANGWTSCCTPECVSCGSSDTAKLHV